MSNDCKENIWMFVARFRHENEAIDKAQRLSKQAHAKEGFSKTIVKRCAKKSPVYIRETEMNINPNTHIIKHA